MSDLPEDPTAFRERVLRDARRDFREFYAQASSSDASLLDGLVLGVIAATVLYRAPRESMTASERMLFEQLGDQVDQLFAAQRQAVRACETFNAISPATRARIERLVKQAFDLP